MVKVRANRLSRRMAEKQAEHRSQAIQKIQQQSITSMEIKESAVKAFVDHTDAFMPRTVWSTGCRVSGGQLAAC